MSDDEDQDFLAAMALLNDSGPSASASARAPAAPGGLVLKAAAPGSAWAFLRAPELTRALDIAGLAKRKEARPWECDRVGCDGAAAAEYARSITTFPAQVESYYRLALLRLRSATTAGAVAAAEALLRAAAAHAARYRAVPPPWSAQPECQAELEAGKQAERRLVLLLLQSQHDAATKEAQVLLKRMGCTYQLSNDIFRCKYDYKTEDEVAALFAQGVPAGTIDDDGGDVANTAAAPGAGADGEVNGPEQAPPARNAGAIAAAAAAASALPAGRWPAFSDRSDPRAGIFFKLFDDTLPPALLRALQSGFAASSPFWRIHGYGDAPFFSYLYRFEDKPRSSLEQAIRHLHACAVSVNPAVARARVAEWWVHSRPHSHGHQLHFDSDDEGRGGIRHPIQGSVCFVAGGVGGSTLVTNQRLAHSTLASQGWLVEPRTNRYLMFDGRYLHGVIPGPGPGPAAPGAAANAAAGLVAATASTGGEPAAVAVAVADDLRSAGPGPRRLTFMVAYWESIQARTRPGPGSAAAGAHPCGVNGDSCAVSAGSVKHCSAMEVDEAIDKEWMELFPLVDDADASAEAAAAEGWRGHREGVPAYVPSVWARCDGQAHTAADDGKLPPYEKCYQGL
jgi:hypothetical protein